MSRIIAAEENSIKTYFDTIKRFNLLDAEQEISLAKEKSDGSESARDMLVNSNLRLVVKIAKNYSKYDLALTDLIQEGNLGLLRAAEKFDHKLGCRFSTYASYWIKHYITRYIATRSRAIRIPIRKRDLFKKILKAKEEFSLSEGREPGIEEISMILGIEERAVREIEEVFQPTISLETPVGEDNGSLHDMVKDSRSSYPDESIYKDELREALRGALDTLVGNEKSIIKLRYGFDAGKPLTLKDLGTHFGVSAETVRQIESRAIAKIKTRYGHLKEYIN